ncbi:cache domain-containing sensor histidine kinase [Cohnella zeiphila]|uniref:Sensor histidine kinase n=1 Tax=Cohnella zeiphila TaxID=2761120 RepID=A0A7X0VUG1_9BACL|nr:sensor histidine kinase [Cohnella zeiphila]MBB6730911.1 sensor histidine kinase [Cohnella zeiphila]
MWASVRTASAGCGYTTGSPAVRERVTVMTAKRRFRLDRISLKTQLILSFVAVTLAVLSATSYYSYRKTMSVLQSSMEDTSLAQFRQIETNVQNLMHEVDKYANTFIYETDVQTFLLSERLSNADFVPFSQDITKLMARYFSNYDYLDSMYLFLDNGMVIGGTPTQNQSSAVLGKDYPFYANPLYLTVKTNYPNVVLWTGGIVTQNFMRTPLANASSNNRLISALRGITSMDSREISAILPVNAVLAINIKERYFHSLYGSLLQGGNGTMGIVDDKGVVISSSNEADIGRSYLFGNKIEPGDLRFGSFRAERDGTKEQVLYYRMSDPDWILINEVPSALYSQGAVAIQRFTAAVFALSVVLIAALSSLWMYRIMGSLQELIKGMRNVGRGHVGLMLPRASNREIGQLTEQFNRMSVGIAELMKQNEEAEREKRRLELEALQSQINPHFLFNTLNTIKWLAAVAGATNIVECVANLGSMLRPIYSSPSPYWTIGEEIAFVRNYANIMNFRYGEEVAFSFDVPEQTQRYLTLRFIVQPLIENALVHGKSGKGDIRVAVCEDGSDIVFVVADTRGGMSLERTAELNRKIRLEHVEGERKGIGLPNVNKRIRLHFGGRYGLSIESEEGVGTRVGMRIPKVREDEVQKP